MHETVLRECMRRVPARVSLRHCVNLPVRWAAVAYTHLQRQCACVCRMLLEVCVHALHTLPVSRRSATTDTSQCHVHGAMLIHHSTRTCSTSAWPPHATDSALRLSAVACWPITCCSRLLVAAIMAVRSVC